MSRVVERIEFLIDQRRMLVRGSLSFGALSLDVAAARAESGNRVLTLGRTSGTMFTVTLVLTFFTWGEVFSLFPSILGDYYGTRHATSNYGVLYSVKGVASIIGGGLAAALYERFGTWSACFYGSAILALVAAGLAFALRASSSSTAPVGVPAATGRPVVLDPADK